MTANTLKNMNLLQRINRKKQQAALTTIAGTMSRIWPAKATLMKITKEFSELGNTPREWSQANPKKQQATINNTRKHLKLTTKEYTPSQAKQKIRELTPLITQFDGTNKTTTKYYLGMPQEQPAQTMIKMLKEEIK